MSVTARTKRALVLPMHPFDRMLFVFFLLTAPLLVLALLIGDAVVERIHAHRVNETNTAFSEEVTRTLSDVQEVADTGEIDEALAANDQTLIANINADLSRRFDLSLLGVANQQGIMVARAASPRTGDFVFQTTPYGKKVARGEASVSVEVVRNYPLAIMAGVPLFTEKIVRGGFFGGYALDDRYAKSFKERYLHQDEQILFYGKTTGIYGSSITDPSLNGVLRTNISRGSEWIQHPLFGLYRTPLRVHGKDYHVGNIPMFGIDGEVGGAFLLFPVRRFPWMAFGAFLILLYGIFAYHVLRKHRHHRLYCFCVSSFVLLTSVCLGWFLYQRFFFIPSIMVNDSPFTIYNSTMTLAPDSDILDLSSTQSIAIRVDSGGEEINAVLASVHIDPKQAQIDNIVMDNSFCNPELVFEKSIDRKNGIATVTCGVLGGFVGRRSVLAELTFHPLQAGPLEVHFVTGTQVLANDGLGTDVLRSVTNGFYSIASHKKDGDESLILFSSTHPNQSRWYNTSTLRIDWKAPKGAQRFAYTLDHEPDTVPDGTKTTNEHEIAFPYLADGIYYFHLRTLDSKQLVRHLRVKIDTTPPEPPVIHASATVVERGEIVRFSFGSEDKGSGVQKNFYVSIDGGIWLPSQAFLFVPFQTVGQHRVQVRVFDQAENFRDSSLIITVK